MDLNGYLQAMSRAANVSVADIMGRSRRPELCVARNIIWLHLWEVEHLSTTQIGQRFGRAHATVLHGIKNARDYGNYKCYRRERGIMESFINGIDKEKELC